jgi:hypothetical protein
MQNFKSFLLKEDNEEKHYPWQITTNEELAKLENWQEDELDGKPFYSQVEPSSGEVFLQGSMKNGKFEILSDWPFIDDSLLIDYQGGKYLPFEFKEWKNPTRNGDLTLETLNITSLIGLPDIVKGSFNIMECHGIKSLEGCPSIIKGLLFNWIDMPITNHINKTVKQVKKIILPYNYNGFLSFLLINKLQNFLITGSTQHRYPDINNKLKAQVIVNSHLVQDKDILECQEELITKGLKDYAKL